MADPPMTDPPTADRPTADRPTADRPPPGSRAPLPADQARQGEKHNVVRYVLAVSLVLVILGFVLSYVFTRP